MEINLKANIPGVKSFTWYEALYHPQWNVCVIPSIEIEANILHFAPKAQRVRDFLGMPMLVTSWLRAPKYNRLIGGAEESWHMTGGAMDFRCPLVSADELRDTLYPKLEEFGLRMEDLPGSNWVHIDDKEPGRARFFRP